MMMRRMTIIVKKRMMLAQKTTKSILGERTMLVMAWISMNMTN